MADEPIHEGGEERTVYVGNITWDTNDEKLTELFSPFGTIVKAEVQYRSGRSMGWALVEFETSVEVGEAIAHLDGVDLDGRAIRVRPDKGKARRPVYL